MQTRISALLALALFSATACGRHHEGGGEAAPKPDAGSGETALTDTQKAALDLWAAAPLKMCNAAAIFAPDGAGDTGDTTGIDAAWLQQKLGGRLEIETDKGFVVFSAPGGTTMQSETTYEASTSLNGNSVSLSTSTKSNGLRCDVAVGGTVVKTAYIYAGLRVAEGFHSGKEAPAAVRLIAPKFPNRLDDLNVIDATIGQAMTPDNSDLTLARVTLGLGDAGDSLIINGAGAVFSRNTGSFYQFPDVASLPPAAASAGMDGIAGTAAEIKKLRAGGAAYSRIFLRSSVDQHLSVPDSDAAESPFTVRRLQATLKFTPAGGGSLDRFASIETITPAQPMTPSADEALQCAEARLDRLAAITGVAPNSSLKPGSPYPAARSVLGPCENMRENFALDLVSSARGRTYLARVFEGTDGTKDRVRFLGWDGVFFDAAAQTLGAKQDLATSLDPNGKMPLVVAAARFVKEIRAAVAAHPAPHVFDGGESNLGITWALNAETAATITPSALDELFRAAANLDDPFSEAGKNLLAKAKDLAAIRADAEYAATIDEATKAAARTAVAKADAAKAAPYVASRLADVIEKKLGAAKWLAYVATLDALGAYVTRDRARAVSTAAKFDFDNAIDALVNRSMDEGWGAADFAALEKISMLAVYDDFCKEKLSTAAAAVCFADAAISKGDKQFFSPAFGNRYVVLVDDFSAALSALSDEDFFSQRHAILRAFPSPIWKSCDAARFATKRAAFLAAVKKLPGSDYPARFDVVRALDATIQDCD